MEATAGVGLDRRHRSSQIRLDLHGSSRTLRPRDGPERLGLAASDVTVGALPSFKPTQQTSPARTSAPALRSSRRQRRRRRLAVVPRRALRLLDFDGRLLDRNAPFGNTGRNILTGPGQKNVDFSVVKYLPFTERWRGEFRTEFFNIFNWANFANPNSNVSVPATFGRITQTSAGPRVIQFAFKLNF